MSIRMMIKKCPYCGHRYSYNPSVGRFVPLCPKCGKYQRPSVPQDADERIEEGAPTENNK